MDNHVQTACALTHNMHANMHTSCACFVHKCVCVCVCQLKEKTNLNTFLTPNYSQIKDLFNSPLTSSMTSGAESGGRWFPDINMFVDAKLLRGTPCVGENIICMYFKP